MVKCTIAIRGFNHISEIKEGGVGERMSTGNKSYTLTAIYGNFIFLKWKAMLF